VLGRGLRPPLSPLLVAAMAGAMPSLDTSVNIALPAITRRFSLGLGAISWVVVGYVLTYAALLLGFGRLADTIGHRRVLLAGLSVSLVGFLLCAAAPSFALLVGARVVQGAGAGMVLGSAPALVTLSVPPERRSRALGLFQLCVSAGFAAGAPVGGIVLGAWGWSAVWWFRLPVGAVLLLLVATTPSWPEVPRARRADGAGVDVPGALTLAVALAGLLLAASRGRDLGWTSLVVVGAVIVGMLASVAFVLVERRSSHPVVDLALFRLPGFALANLLNLAANASGFIILLIVPYYLVTVRGLGPVAGGLVLGATPLATAAAAPLAGRLAERISLGPLSVVALGLEAVGLAATSQLRPGTSLLLVIGALGLTGLGLGLFQVPNQSFVMGSIPRAAQGVAGSITQAVRTVGVLVGVAAGGTLLEVRQTAHASRLGLAADAPASFVPAFRDVFLAAALLAAVAALTALFRALLGGRSVEGRQIGV
jgi:EmrB/QacA subfamily drug resistance transporter